MKTIQWYPGHMAKARREINEKLSMIDVVIELLDARIPVSSQNPVIDELVQQKPRLILLNKTDLADPKQTERWKHFFEKQGHAVVEVNSQTGQGIKKIVPACQALAKDLYKKWESKGMKPRALRAVILGIPNVGKSTFINRLVNKRQAKVGDRPGITKQQQWIKVGTSLDLLDTPGILWPKFEDQEVGFRLAATGAIKDELLDYGDVAAFVLRYCLDVYPELLQKRYQLDDDVDGEDVGRLFDEIGRKRGCMLRGGLVDYDRTAELLLRELRSGTIGRITLERVPTPE
ncbi:MULTISPECIES: ribosome biogenesis GTPase YlqF [Shouchella]|uniref:Ribosome biogenesis GTPase A n=3 Tax=Bacillaceae TaxID=186817 RepID=A0A060LUE2_9BACI|nr:MULTISPECIES: ribosome biogenesis GTPase YlqF [Bacillaceae]RQW20694.1 ribosome biogenesis GTPase YlqF [Bacillus sp. C1-1]AIC94851.1 ribosome biogenesis GTPase [Shouchella lehensis G1]KQL58219.1 GTPase [Alkalicoccobacillus plakortidis]MBG9784295.1 GTPase [Shouchella lehensis]TES50714.1 ribosome biogenesis GTPase YlqF [Shouchella lehensis]